MPTRGASKRNSAPPESEAEGPARVTRSRRGQSSEPPPSPIQGRGRGRAAANRTVSPAVVDPALSTVHEQTEHELPMQMPNPDDQWTTDSNDNDTIILDLTVLYEDAESLLKVLDYHVSNNTHAAAMENPRSKLRRRIDAMSNSIRQQMDDLGASGGYLDALAIEAAVFRGNDTASELSRLKDIKLDDIIHKINLALFATIICEWYLRSGNDPVSGQMLKHQNDEFPAAFAAGFIDDTEPLRSGYSHLIGSTRRLAVEMRTQRAILNIISSFQDELDADPAFLLREIFYDPDDGPGEDEVKTVEILEQCPLRPWKAQGLGDLSRIVQERINELDTVLLDEDGENAFESNGENLHYIQELNNLYSWADFCIMCLVWLQERYDELNTQIQHRGGVETILTMVKKLRNNEFKDFEMSAMMAVARAATLASQPNFETAPEQMTPMQSQYQLQSQPTSAFQTPSASHRQETYEDFDDVRLTQAQAQSQAQAQQQQQQQRSMLDSQLNGSKVGFSDSIPHGTQPSGSRRKRKRVDDGDEVSGDEGYRIPRKPRQTAPQSSLRTSDFELSNPSVKHQANEQGLPASQPPEDEFAQFANFSQEFNVATQNIAVTYEQVRSTGRSLAEKRKAEAKADDDHKVQERKRWSSEETAALIKYIELLGTSWAQIQKADAAGNQILINRDQVALKDKARNLKFDYLKANATVPKNFEAVSLSKSMKNKLEAWNLVKFVEGEG